MLSKLLKIPQKLFKYCREIKYKKTAPIQRRNDDIYLVSFPRSGSTWISFLIANAIIKYLDLNMNVNFYNLHFFLPDIHISRNIDPNLQYYPFRRIIKSHTSFNPLYRNVFLLLRNPLDVMHSYYYYLKNLDKYDNSISAFIRDNRYGIHKWVENTQSWLNMCYPAQSIQLFYYEDFLKEPGIELKLLFELMGFPLNDKIINYAINKSDLKTMKRIEKETQNFSITKFEKFKFIRKGKSGIFKKELNDSHISYIIDKAGKTMKRIGYNINTIY